MPMISPPNVRRFNLLGEILFVQADGASHRQSPILGFQSLGRDSVCSSSARFVVELEQVEFQSLGRDSVCSSDG